MTPNAPSPSRLIIIGHYGSGNYGDDMMLQALINELEATSKSITVIYFGDQTTGITSNRVNFYTIDRSNKILMLLSWVKLLLSADQVIWGGGTCFTDEEGDGFFIGMAISKLLGKKIIYRSVGIGNLNRTSRRIKTKILLNICSHITFRENQSISFAEKLTPRLNKKFQFETDLGDQYLRSIKADTIKDNEISDYTLVAWRDLSQYNQENKTSSLLDFISRQAITTNNKVIILDTDNIVDKKTNDNIELGLQLRHPLLKIKRVCGASFSEKTKIIANAKKIITARLHVGVAAKHFEIKTYIHPYSPKINYAFPPTDKFVEVINL